MLAGITPPHDSVALVALGVIVVGLGVLAAAYLLTVVGWLVARGFGAVD
jgi:hypothetical protein